MSRTPVRAGATTRSLSPWTPVLPMVYRVGKQLVEEGFEAVLSRKPRATPAVPRIFDGEKEAKLIALACSKPPQGYVRWTLRCQGDGPSYRHRLCAGAERLGRYSLPAQKIHRPGPGQPQYPQQGITLRGFPACRSQAVGRAVVANKDHQ